MLMMQAGMEPGAEGSLNKLVSVRSRQKLSELAIDLRGTDGLAFDARGHLWITSNEINALVRISPTGEPTTVARNGAAGPLEFPAAVVFVGDAGYVANFDTPRRDNLDAGSTTTARAGIGASIARVAF